MAPANSSLHVRRRALRGYRSNAPTQYPMVAKPARAFSNTGGAKRELISDTRVPIPERNREVRIFCAIRPDDNKPIHYMRIINAYYIIPGYGARQSPGGICHD